MIEDLKVFHKTYEFIKWLHFLLNKFPKSEKYTMAQKIENTSLNVLEGIIQSNNDFDKTASLKKTIVELDKLRIFFRMSKDLQFISFEQYEFGVRQIDEIGRMLGGMLKKFGKTENPTHKSYQRFGDNEENDKFINKVNEEKPGSLSADNEKKASSVPDGTEDNNKFINVINEEIAEQSSVNYGNDINNINQDEMGGVSESKEEQARDELQKIPVQQTTDASQSTDTQTYYLIDTGQKSNLTLQSEASSCLDFSPVSPKPRQTLHFSVEYKTKGFGDNNYNSSEASEYGKNEKDLSGFSLRKISEMYSSIENRNHFIVLKQDWVELNFDGRAVYRGGNWNNGANAGPFYANMNNDPSNTNSNIGFRCCSSLEFLPDFESLRRFKTDEIDFQFHFTHFETTSIHTEQKVNFNLKVEIKVLALTFYSVSPKLLGITESFGEIQADFQLNIKYKQFAVSKRSLFLIENCNCYFFLFMKTYKNLFEKVVSFENLNLAYRKARKGKTKRNEVMRFSYNLEKELIDLQRKLINQTYNIEGYRDFIIFEPKKREISALPFKDRVVQHAICNIIEPIFEKSFIFDSYACRKNKGTHVGIKRLEFFLNRGNLNPLYALKCDIKKYFLSINHDILKKIIRKKIGDEKLLNLIDKIIDSKNSRNGIPIGNLTSQLFANIFLNELDKFVKHELRAKYYLRYMDDFIILESDKEILQEYKIKINDFLNSLDLKMHEKKCTIFSVKIGVDFLGYIIFKNYKLARKQTVKRGLRNLKRKIKMYQHDLIDFPKLMESFNSWEAYLNHGNTYLLKNSLKEEFKNIF